MGAPCLPLRRAWSTSIDNIMTISTPFERHLANGALVERGLLGEQGLEGIYEVFDSEGRPCLKCAYLAGERHGTSDYFKNGRLSMRQNLIQNQLQGITQSFDDSERLAAELSYANGLLHGASRFYSQGALSRQAHYLNGMLDGLVEEYSEDGKLLSRSEYSKDQLHGERCLFWPNGKRLQREVYERGVRQGELERFDESGQPLKDPSRPSSIGERLTSVLRGD